MYGNGVTIGTLKNTLKTGKSVHPGWPFNGTSAFFRRVLRGGSWGGTAKGCRVSYIDYDVPNYRDEYGGFRLVLVPDSVQNCQLKRGTLRI